MSDCTTHHHACECREEKFKEMEAENKMLRKLAQAEAMAAVRTEQPDELERLMVELARIDDTESVALYTVGVGTIKWFATSGTDLCFSRPTPLAAVQALVAKIKESTP